ncbi:MAG: DUF2461 domain-containing protein [Crocinitomicaceae bacterium]|jgi:uncharacterized protein (TIGR02453 family)
MPYFSQDYIDFFIELAANNHKDWFDVHRKRYEASVKQPFSAFTQALIDRLATQNKPFEGLLAKDCIFRINRDIRFSTDKTPYKLMGSAVVAPEGKKSTAINGIYYELTPEHVRVYGGVYEIDKVNLAQLRSGIATHLERFESLLNAPDFKAFYGEIHGEKNKVLPAEWKSIAQKQPLLYNKQFYFYATFPVDLMLTDDLMETLVHAYEVGKPMESFFNQFIHRN